MRLGTDMPSKAKWIQSIMFVASLCMLGFAGFLVYSIDVITNWTLELPKQEIHVGDEIVVKSIYTKVRDAQGISQRSLDCKNRDGLYIRYDLNKAVANRPARSGGTGIQVVMPNVPDTPTTCKIAVAIPYEVLKIGNVALRTVLESNETKEFTLLPKRVAELEVGASEQTTQIPEPASVVSGQSVVSSLPKSNPPAVSEQSNSSLKTDSTVATPVPQPTLLETLLSPITNLFGGN